MTGHQWERVQEIFRKALEFPDAERAGYLDNTCGDDDDLRREVETLLQHHDLARSEFLRRSSVDENAQSGRRDDARPGRAEADTVPMGRGEAALEDEGPAPEVIVGRGIGQYHIDPAGMGKIDLSRYTVLAVLGAGGFGTVYRARDEQLERDVAIKIAHERTTRLGDVVAEARVLASLAHPSIVPVYDVGYDDGAFFMVCRFVPGSDLRKVISRMRVSHEEATETAATIAQALHYAHSHKVIHRDVKPENILLEHDEGACLTDFGLATLERRQEVTAGTPRYMSPEQLTGQVLDERTDLWSLGVVFYEMLAGIPPFDGRTMDELRAQITAGRFTPLGAVDERIPPQLASICERCLQVTVPERYASAEQLSRDLQESRSRTTRDDLDLTARANSCRVDASFARLEEQPERLIGIEVAGHRIDAFMGRGGTGAAYAARHVVLGRQVCVKLAYKIDKDLAALFRLLSQVLRGLGQLEHERVVRIRDFGIAHLDDGSSFYLITDYVDAVSLTEWSHGLAAGAEAFRSRLDMATRIAEVLRDVHGAAYIDAIGVESRGFLHGDLKPANILVDRDDQPVVNDFMLIDVQRFIESTAAELDSPTRLLGTPGFMPPEQETDGVLTVRGDVYTLGRTLQELFVADLAMPDRLGRPERRGVVLLRQLLSDMTQRDPRERPADMRVVLKRLAGIRRRSRRWWR